MGALGAAEAALAGIGLATSLIGRQEKEKAQEQAIKLRLEAQTDATLERSTQRARRLNEVMASAVAREGASGLAVGSPSFFAIGLDNFNQFAEDSNADALNLNFDKLAAAQTQKSIRRQQFFGSMGDITNAGKSMFDAGVFKSTSPNSAIAKTQFEGPENIPGPEQSDPFGRLFAGTNLDFIL